jgi:beta-glucosidase
MAADLVAKMTKQERAAQMVMAPNPTVDEVRMLAPGAVFAGGSSVPPGGFSPTSWAAMIDGYTQAAAATRLAVPILYGVDALHGNNKATGAVIFPHNIGLGCTRDPALVQEVARLTALEVAAMGATWTFGPMVSVAFDDRWGREYESFSEDATLTGQMGAAATLGLQGATGLGTGRPGIVACAKHFAGDGQATAGTSSKGGVVDRGDIRIDEAAMRKYGIAPYLLAIQGGLGSIMVSDARWNGASLTASSQIMTTILKGELGFRGFISTDWNAATDSGGGVVNSVNAGVDMLMQPADWKGTINVIAAGVPDARMNDAVSRILAVKCEAGLFTWKRDPAALATIGAAEHRAVARRAVRESLVLLQNANKVLPLAKTTKVWVGGSGANNLTNQCGGWTITWQGDASQTQGTTIAQALAKVTVPATTMAQADVAVIVLSEGPYAEFRGDVQSIDTLPAADFMLLDQAKAAGKKVVAIVVSGRPSLIATHLASADAWVAAWLPGTEGDGIADVLVGDVAPRGKLSHSWPRTQAQTNVNIGDPGYDPLFPLGFGLTY